MNKQFYNKTEDIVVQSLEGLVASNTNLVRLDGFPDIKVIRCKILDGSKVAVISGGGSGHEPSFGGMVGAGMLSAAVCGEVFASPSMDAVLAAIRSCTGPAGCLLLPMNYTGDRLNFGLAAEQAKLEGLKVEMVVIGEDCSLPPPRGIAGRRGLCGTLLVHKVAGALAESGASLAEVRAQAEAAASQAGTVGVALAGCTLPGQPPSTRIPAGHMELGLGIHGEPGAESGPLQDADQVVGRILAKITCRESNYLPIESGECVALLVNSLGSTPPLELNLLTTSALAWLKENNIHVSRLFTGMFMSSLDMVGFSLTLMKLTPGRTALLDAPHGAPAWPAHAGIYDSTKVPLALPNNGPSEEPVGGPPSSPAGALLQRAILAAAERLVSIQDSLTKWDTVVGDGDCGITATRGAKAIIADSASRYPLDSPSGTALQLGLSVRRSMGGTSGALYDIFFHAAAAALKLHPPPNQGAGEECARAWAGAFAAGVAAMQYYGGASAGDRTMLDALLPAAAELSLSLSLPDAAKAARQGAKATRSMAAGAGRSSYVPVEQLKDTPDPGAQAAAAWIEAVAEALA